MAKKGIPLVLNFPYTRLTTSEVVALFRAYNIRLGISNLQDEDIVRGIQNLDRVKFESLINQAFDKLKSFSFDYFLILDQDELGSLRIYMNILNWNIRGLNAYRKKQT